MSDKQSRIFAIGDLQGCFDPFRDLLDHINFDPSKDKLWLTGDLINRGPQSLKTLRFVKSLQESAITVLGNHDLHFLAAYTQDAPQSPKDTFQEILEADDCDELVEWLRLQPLVHFDPRLDTLLVHAGIYPMWNLDTTLSLAAEVETILRGPTWRELMANMYGNTPDRWQDSLTHWDRIRFIVNCFTRMRFCTLNGALALKHKGTPGAQTLDIPWFKFPQQSIGDKTILFGHWSTLGSSEMTNIIPLDSGCVWGGSLTAYEVNSRRYYKMPCMTYCNP